jgi:hypothetical protein
MFLLEDVPPGISKMCWSRANMMGLLAYAMVVWFVLSV